MAKIRTRMGLGQRQILGALLFTSPFIVGFVLFFLYPFVQAVIFSLSELKLGGDGYTLVWQGMGNYYHALQKNPDFNRTFVESMGDTLSGLPLILGFSLFAATLLNQEFRGRAVARAMLFMPVILGSGVVLKMQQMDWAAIMAGESARSTYFGTALRDILYMIRLPESVVTYLVKVIGRSPGIIAASGVQILVFLAGLQSIPASIYEAADVEGATGWEKFWLVTFPSLSPLILANVVYTVVDSLTTTENALVTLIEKVAFGGAGFGVGMAMSMLYFLSIAVLLGVVCAIISRHVFYNS